MAGVLDQVIADTFMQNQQGLQNLPQTFMANQDAARMRTLQSQLREGIESGASMLEQSPLFAQMATVDPRAASEMQNLFATLNKNQVVDMFVSVPLALGMSYSEASSFWENKKREYANNPNALTQIDKIIKASPKERAQIYGGSLSMGQDLGVLPKPKQAKDTRTAKTREFEKYRELKERGDPLADVYADVIGIGEGRNKDTSAVQNLKAAGFEPGSEEFKQAMTEVLSVAGGAGKKAVSKKLGDLRGELTTGYYKDALKAEKSKADLQGMLNALETVDTGVGAQVKSIVGKYVPGIDPSDEQSLNAAINTLVPIMLQNFPGQISNFEIQFSKDTVGNLGLTTEANKRILKSMLQSANEVIDRREAFKEFRKDNDDIENFTYEFQPKVFTGEQKQMQQAPQQSLAPLNQAELAELEELKSWMSERGFNNE